MSSCITFSTCGAALGALRQEDLGHAALADLAQHAVTLDQELRARQRRGIDGGRRGTGALARLRVGHQRFAQHLEHARRRVGALARHQAGHFDDVDEAVVRQAHRADAAGVGAAGRGQAGAGGGRHAPVQVHGRHFQQARHFDRVARGVHLGAPSIGAPGDFRHAQVRAGGQAQERQVGQLRPAGHQLRQLHGLVHQQDGGMQATLRVVGLLVVRPVAEDGQDRVGPALRDLATQLHDGFGQQAPHLVDEGSGLVGPERVADRREVVQPGIDEGRDGLAVADAAIPHGGVQVGGGGEVAHPRRLGRFGGRAGFERLSHLVTCYRHLHLVTTVPT
ncbi:hypothetical protein [Ramlibacter montanisoli]|uniref:Uncharacterized protein n=1 Tax=Ramlibacter montanisoli TaxID=2732512 RepID=A0A849KE56_9BURK|nr:hypothetical protein [Ramlibacter montanisoli]NNU42493.1 hypothetical protein [Ramlibacter montanisoli]